MKPAASMAAISRLVLKQRLIRQGPANAAVRDEHEDAVTCHQPGIAWGRLGGLGRVNLVPA